MITRRVEILVFLYIFVNVETFDVAFCESRFEMTAHFATSFVNMIPISVFFIKVTINL